MADMCFMAHLVCLFMTMHLLALLQDNCRDWVCYTFLCKLPACMRNITAFCQYLLRPCHFLTDFIQILQMFILWDNDNLSKISGKLERVP